ncbi:hypothetical protein HAX54_032233 [Datura stramonium]|uniref:Cystatin domain-containing protein n=1 Tax=Datura stramonium TaxID=4076 RepID=A0ABS8RLU2_DATST|nr:hypothetical protein [Datura stramonium]
MAIKFNPIFGTLLVVVATILLHVSDAQGGRKEVIVGGWKRITDVTAPEIVEIGKFAVDEHNKKAKTNLIFQKIIKGESQVVEGINYRLVITAKDGDSPHNYFAEVWDKPGKKSRSLTYFEELVVATILLHVSDAQGGRKEAIVGGWTHITKLTDPETVEIGKFAVDEYNKEEKENLEFEEVINEEKRVFDDKIMYRLKIAAKKDDFPQHYLAEVLDRPLEKLRKLISFHALRCSHEKGGQNCKFT